VGGDRGRPRTARCPCRWIGHGRGRGRRDGDWRAALHYNARVAPDTIGRYEIVEILGRGASGVVYLARDPVIDRQVALKTLRLDLDTDLADEFRERFLREARAAGRLNHPGIVTVHDVGEDPASGLLWIAMELVEGRDLKQIIASGQRFRHSEAARIAADVAIALDYAHAMGVVHRDIKPANVILTRDGSPKITDFGVARLESSNLTVEGQFIGTPNFMSPEQITAGPVDGRSDLFSLGVVLFTMLTGRRPFIGETMHEVTRRIVEQPCPIPSTVAADLPPAFNPILLKCLHKDPAARFQTGGELAEVLAALARSLVHREAGDSERTGVFHPDLETRVRTAPAPPATPPPVTGARPAAARRRRSGPGPVERIRSLLPAPLFWKVRPAWGTAIVAAAALAVGATAGSIALRLDRGPYGGPSHSTLAVVAGAGEALREARRAAAEGRYAEAERAALTALDQVPSPPAARRLLAQVRRELEHERLSEETRTRVEDAIRDGRELFRRDRFGDAAARFRTALELDPGNEIAASFLELSQERDRQRRARRVPAGAPPTPAARSVEAELPTAPARSPTPASARLTVVFNSPINAGSIVVSVDDRALEEVPFDFTSRGFLGIRRRGSGTVKRVMLVPAGGRALTVRLHDAERGVLGSETFGRALPGGTDWTLRVDLPDQTREPAFYLVQVGR